MGGISSTSEEEDDNESDVNHDNSHNNEDEYIDTDGEERGIGGVSFSDFVTESEEDLATELKQAYRDWRRDNKTRDKNHAAAVEKLEKKHDEELMKLAKELAVKYARKYGKQISIACLGCILVTSGIFYKILDYKLHSHEAEIDKVRQELNDIITGMKGELGPENQNLLDRMEQALKKLQND